jgi:hypothetical protein
MDADHDTYATVPAIAGAADVIVSGQVVSHTTEPGESPGADALGDPLPAIPRTDYSVAVSTVFKGAVGSGSTIHVVIAGGTNAEGKFVLDGAPEIQDGEAALFFLVSGGDGRYYPLAGGAAVAARVGPDTYSLPPDATGESGHVVSEGEVRAALGSSPPAATIAASAAAAPAPGHRAPHHHCRKGLRAKKVRGKARCVKARRHHKHKHRKHHRG